MVNYIKENISWLKDLFTLLFAATGTVVAILTYRRARATILQPIRTEVIKKQSEILSQLLQSLKENEQSFERGLDYVELVSSNVLLTLHDYGFIFKDDTEIVKRVNTKIGGWTHCGKSNILKDVEIIGAFKEKKETKTEDIGKNKFNDLKKGEIDIDKIYLTKKHVEFLKLISEFRDNPFMPSSIQSTLTELTNDVSNNITIILKGELESFMIKFSKKYFEGNTPNIEPVGVYNDFNHSRTHHRETADKLKKEIRKYLRIDEGW